MTAEELHTRLLAVLTASVVVSVALFFLGWVLCDQQQRDTATRIRGWEEREVQREFNRSRIDADLQEWAKGQGWEPPVGIGPD